MDRVGEMMRLLLECTPEERADFMSRVRGKTVESRRGLLTRDDFERAIAATKNLNEAAEQLGIARRTLQSHMRLLGFPPGRPGHRA